MEDNISNLTYAAAVAELEQIVAKMQMPDCDIDMLAKYTTRAIALLGYCKKKLHTTEEEVRQCLATLSEA
ncbi:MAG: exodeoxyribonuclease VII small subunit [Muribaculaceae bacterium]|nr:exodeoxyribonuclease VII small subunit [Muribaculaceae bacterium]MDE5924650.1 exodeoxyribonuclease VII small subunit [Muribaculaceae bacterium]